MGEGDAGRQGEGRLAGWLPESSSHLMVKNPLTIFNVSFSKFR